MFNLSLEVYSSQWVLGDGLGEILFVNRHHGLRSKDEASLTAAADLYGALWEIEEHEPGAAEYDVGHSATLYVVDDEGQIIWEFSFGSEAEAMAAALESLIAERYA